MKRAIFPLIMAGMLAGNMAYAADDEDEAREAAQDNLEAKLDAASARLEEAAHEVAEISAEMGRPVMERLQQFEGPRHAVIGVQLDPASGKDGAKIRDVSPGGPAAQAGIQAKDVIIRVNGTEVKGDSAREVARLMREVDPEQKVNVRVLREGKPKDFVVIARPVVFPMFDIEVPPVPPIPPVPLQPGMSFERNVMFTRPFGADSAARQLLRHQ
jgi:C-terminal processing protease CtpA/Prc